MKPSALAVTATFGAVAAAAALICAPGAAARTAAPGANPGAAARPAAAAPGFGPAAAPQVRVDQVGYPPAASKTAFVMLPRAAGSVRFVVTDPRGGVRLSGRSTD